MQPLYLLTAVDVRRATQAGSSRPNLVSKLTLPPIKFVGADHNPGGGVMAVNFTMPRIEAVEPAFAVKGFDTDVFSGMGLVDRWIFGGATRDKKTNKGAPARAVIEGAIVEWTPDEADPAEFVGCSHAFREVTHYEFWLNGKELWYVDFWERILRVNGVDLFAEERQALGA